MISTVTTSTVSTVTTSAIAGSVALIGIILLFVLLIQKELATATINTRLKKMGQALNIGIAPLLIAFVVISIVKIVEVLH